MVVLAGKVQPCRALPMVGAPRGAVGRRGQARHRGGQTGRRARGTRGRSVVHLVRHPLSTTSTQYDGAGRGGTARVALEVEVRVPNVSVGPLRGTRRVQLVRGEGRDVSR